jgi:hypothetical protein
LVGSKKLPKEGHLVLEAGAGRTVWLNRKGSPQYPVTIIYGAFRTPGAV